MSDDHHIYAQSAHRGPRKAEERLTWAVSGMYPVHVYYKFWMLHVGVRVHKSTSMLVGSGREREVDVRTVGMVKATRQLFPY